MEFAVQKSRCNVFNVFILRFATAHSLSMTGALRSILPTASGPTAIFSMYMSGAFKRLSRSAMNLPLLL
jgi:hypothetical protein